VRADEGHGVHIRHAVNDREAREGRPGAPEAAGTGDLDPAGGRPPPGLGQRPPDGVRVGGQAEIRPP